MSKIIARPRALLDGASQPGQLLPPNSDAFRYVEEGRVFEDYDSFLHDIPILANPQAIRLAGSVGSPKIEGRELMSVRGEDQEDRLSLGNKILGLISSEDKTPRGLIKVRYGFDVMGAEFGDILRISRIVGLNDTEATVNALGVIQLDNVGTPLFYEPGILDDPSTVPLEDEAKKSELTQITAAGVDAMEWAFD